MIGSLITSEYCDKDIKARAAEGLYKQLKEDVAKSFINPHGKIKWAKKLYFKKELVRMRRIRDQIAALKVALKTATNL